MHVKAIKANLKGIDIDLVDLKPNVVLHGKNGGGKTAVLHAMQAGLTGGVFDYAGRDEVKLAEALAELVPAGEEGVRSEVTFGDVATDYNHLWVVKDGKPARADGGGPDLRFIYTEAERALIGTKPDARAYPWLLTSFVDDKEVQRHQPKMDDETLANFGRYAKAQAHIPSRTARLAGIIAKARKDLNAHKATAKRIEIALEVLYGLSSTQKAGIFESIEYLTAFQLEKELTTCGVCGTGDIHLNTLEQRRQTASERLRDLEDVHVAVRLVKALTSNLESTRAKIEPVQRVLDVALEWSQAAVQSQKKDIEGVVNKRMPRWLRITLDFGKRFRILKVKKGQVAEPISGAETVVVVTAFAAAAANNSGAPCIIIPPDRAYDSDHARALMAILEASSASGWLQLISVPRGRRRADWTYVAVDGSSAKVEKG